MDLGNLELERRCLARAVSTCEGPSTPGRPYSEPIDIPIRLTHPDLSVAETETRTTVDLSQVGELSKRLGVPEGHVDDAVVRERRHRRDSGRLLAPAVPRSRYKETAELAP